MIKGFEPRLYQQTILATAAQKNTLVVLPTGMGKTNVFLMLAAQRLKSYPQSKILFIGPTKPLIDQYLLVFERHFEIPKEKMAVFTGLVAPQKREKEWKEASIIFSTPQGLENDIISGKIDLSDVSLLGFDEAHRAVGNYSYVFLAKKYHAIAKYPRIVAMTASPGSDMEKIRELCQNLFIEGIEVRTDNDPDVRPYVQQVEVEWKRVDLPPLFSDARKPFLDFIRSRSEKLRSLGLLKGKGASMLNKSELLGMQAELRSRMSSGEKDFDAMVGISVLAEIMKVSHAIELLETQGVVPLQKYIEKLYSEARSAQSKAIKNVVSDEFFKIGVVKVRALFDEKIEHPKLVELQHLVERKVKQDPKAKMIIFNQYRDNASDIAEKLNALIGVSAQMFVGQQKKGETGLSQKEQKQMLEDFRSGFFNVLVATSIGEEGLDIPKVDSVIFYEPVPSAIRQIQRRGRTGRNEKGSVIILFTKDTRDEAYRYVAQHKERKMHLNLEQLKRNIGFDLGAKKEERKDADLSSYSKTSQVVIYADYREKGSGIVRDLSSHGLIVKLETLAIADYVLSSRVAVEFKTIPDFVDSIIDGRLLAQIKDLKNSYSRPLLIIEGNEDIYSVRGVHPNSIMGMISTVAVSFGIPILSTKNSKETSALLRTIAKREQEEVGSSFSPHADRKPLTLKEQQEYVVSSLPGVGPILSKPLLEKFKSIKNLMNASLYELQEVEGIGKVKAAEMKRVIDEEYKK